MASGKKGKKNKGVTVALNTFLKGTGGSVPTQPIRKSAKSWADEVDDYDAVDPKAVNVVLPTEPKASRDFDDVADRVPKEPPYMAYISNLPYDVDEDEIADFFRNMKIKDMTIPKESGETSKLKGFGYIEFEDRESLMSALIIPDTNLKNRRIRIEVATNADTDRRRGGRMGDRMGSADTGGDWRTTNRPDPVDERRGGGFSREGREGSGGAFTREGMRDPRNREGGFSRDRDSGFSRDKDSGFSRDRDSGFSRDRDSGFSRDRDAGFSRDHGRDREGGFSRNRDQDERPGAWRDGDRDRDRGFSRPSYRDDDRDRRGGGFRRYDDREERNGGFSRNRHDDRDERNEGFTRSSNKEDKDDRDQERPSSEPRQRPKLQLAPRTKPLEPTKTEPSVPSASIFGNAKPVDTAERERQIEEKLLKQQEERLTEPTKERRDKDKGVEDSGEKKNYERGRPRRDDRDGRTSRDEDTDNRDRGPPSRDRRNVSGEDDRGSASLRSDSKSPDKKKHEKQEKPKHEDRRGKQDVEMPKLQETEPPNFQGSNKFALLDDNSD